MPRRFPDLSPIMAYATACLPYLGMYWYIPCLVPLRTVGGYKDQPALRSAGVTLGFQHAFLQQLPPVCLGHRAGLCGSREPNCPWAHVAPRSLAIQGPVLTSKWCEGSDYVQVVEMVLRNTDNFNAFIAADKLTITAVSDFNDMVQPALVKRIMPGQEVVV
ncbi:uncharacterized protein PgNI_07168 [Pyricularia grisea]|uniref:Uncharacterized protein n=1 Tax=Pyricularia grisea TaxID=148305 RepID=A0A6P8B1H6_PYRGI|nr:uncharacterized protein PgNI_07168 [Pyricularia grisea]TLD08578.1 hypothetical protein PgNI_07168 [Pyricularia grisea]